MTQWSIELMCDSRKCVKILLERNSNYNSLNSEALTPKDISLSDKRVKLYNKIIA